MQSAASAIKSAMASEPPLSDGRRERSLASRRKILEAMVDLVAAGDPNPSAAAVADKAGVGLRSVFRHFQDKDSILREIDDRLVETYQPILSAPYEAEGWKAQLFELIERRCAVNEVVVVFRLSSILARYRSPFVVKKSRQLHAGEKRMLDRVLPQALQTSTPLGQSIMTATSFDTWRFLRQDEELSPQETLWAIKRMVTDIIAHMEDEA
ncbi:MAG: TetR/AcrR family transcriptional regulator, partial [Pseudomonadota bacterium]